MVYALLMRSTLLEDTLPRTRLLPRAFTRQKSITQAIEAGKRRASPSNRFSASFTPKRSARDGDGDAGPRLDRGEGRHGAFDPTPAYRREMLRRGDGDREAERRELRRGSMRDNEDRRSSAQPRVASSRFGRVGPPRGRDEGMPSGREDGDGEREADFRREGEAGSERVTSAGADAEHRTRRSFETTNTWPSKDRLNKHGGKRHPSWNLDGKDGRAGFDRTSERRRDVTKSNDRKEGAPGQTPYIQRDNRGGVRDAERRPYGARRTEGGERGSDHRANGHTHEAARSFQSGPESLPYTTAASEFIYGHSSVLAAIKANRRKLYKLYVHSQRGNRDGLMAKVRALKLFGITKEVGDEYLRAMDKASAGRPHNGVVLESSPLPVPPIVALRTPSVEHQNFGVVLDTQSAEDVLVNGKNELYSYKSAGWRHPLILYIDGVLDEGNLGAMARSAYFLGVDAIATSNHHIAPWSHIALKASAGAAEAIPIFKVGKPADFLTKSSQAGWSVYASSTVPPTPPSIQSSETNTSKVVYTLPRSSKRLDVDHCPVTQHPTILMMGAEASGLNKTLSNLAHYNIGIPHGRDVNEVGVDSLNVSVAASLLCYEMLQKPKAKPDRKPEELLF